ncbi:MAG: DinB family protein [Bacteroidia bacterium]|nr:DinB family protein [Bacteroidia bacterium]
MSTFSLAASIQMLERTPTTLNAMLHGLDDIWISKNEGPDTWSPFDVVGHLIYGEKTDWIPRMNVILSDGSDKTFEPFDRFAQFRESDGKNMADLLDEFTQLRRNNLALLANAHLTDDDLSRTGTHPALGQVTLQNLLATWVVHDLNHIAQISRVMAKQYIIDVGPWVAYLGVLKR